jgi:AraC-like DNA-binding protein
MMQAGSGRRGVVVLPQITYVGRFAGGQDSVGLDNPVTELMCVTEGMVDVSLGSFHERGGPGACFVYPRHARPRKRTAHMRTTYIFFDAPASTFAEDARVIRLERGDPTRRWIEDLCELHHAAVRGPATLDAALLRAILERLNQVEQRRHEAEEVHPALAAAVASIQRDPAAPLSVIALAAEAGVSASHLTALFRREFGCGPLAYQQRLRIERAERLLYDPYLTVRQVAQACGYDDANYFLRVFRKARGEPPGRWRRGISGGRR